MALVIRPSRIHAAGVFTTTPIRKGSRVVEYSGPRLSPEKANELYDGASRTYLYGLEDGKTVIDGEGMGAYLNHSCDPNCEVDEIKNRVWILAIRNIAAGEELLWDYNLYDDDDSCALPLRLDQVPWNDVFAGMDGLSCGVRLARRRKNAPPRGQRRSFKQKRCGRKIKLSEARPEPFAA